MTIFGLVVRAERGDSGAEKDVAGVVRERFKHQERILQVVQNTQDHGEAITLGRKFGSSIHVNVVDADFGVQNLFELADSVHRVVVAGGLVDTIDMQSELGLKK